MQRAFPLVSLHTQRQKRPSHCSSRRINVPGFKALASRWGRVNRGTTVFAVNWLADDRTMCCHRPSRINPRVLCCMYVIEP